MVFIANIRYKDMMEDYVLSGFFCFVAHFPHAPTADVAFSFQVFVLHFSVRQFTPRSLLQLCLFKLNHHAFQFAPVDKRDPILFTPGVLPVNNLSLFLFLCVRWMLQCETSQVRNNTYIYVYIYIYIYVCVKKQLICNIVCFKFYLI